MLGAGIGALGRGVQTSIAGGSPEMLAYLAQGPVRAAKAYQEGITSMSHQDVPVFAARPTPDRKYFS
jgi:ribosome modulation factor